MCCVPLDVCCLQFVGRCLRFAVRCCVGMSLVVCCSSVRGVRCLCVVVYWCALCVVCCLLCVDCCLLFVACWLMRVVRCVLFAVCS